MNVIPEALIFLGAALVIVLLFKKAGLSTVLGYLAAGTVVGPYVLALVDDIEDIRQFAALGIVLLFFVVGLEIQPARLWALRGSIFGMGGLQMIATTALLYLISIGLGLSSSIAIIIALVLSLSSTAAAFETLAEKHQLATQHGRSSTAVILFQDLAIVPILAAVQYLSPEMTVSGAGDIWLATGLAILGLAVIILGGRYLLRPFFRLLAATRNSGLLTAGALFVLLGAALLMDSVRLPMELGAFLAGVLLADSEYRHELEFRIEPFKGLLLGLFFMAVGMSIDWNLIIQGPVLVIGLTVGLIAVKFTVLFLVGKLYKHTNDSAINLGLTLSQAGEFAFVILTLALAVGVMDSTTSSWLLVVVALSMAATPVLFALNNVLRRFYTGQQSEADVAASRKLRVFVSYSRRNADQALRLASLLEAEGFDITIDTRDLPFGEEWQAELDYLIRESDTVIWLVSLASIQSTWCKWELGRVSEYGKRLVPVAIEEVPLARLPADLGKVQILPQTGVFDVTDAQQAKLLTDTLRTNRHWLKEHTRLSERARLWEDDNRSSDWLLRGAELAAAEKWRDEMPQTATNPGTAVLDFIHFSRVAER